MNASGQYDVTVVIAALAHSERLDACLDAMRLGSGGYATQRVCVVLDPDAEARAGGDPDTIWLYPRMNLGWAGAVHLARAHAAAPLMWLLQDDVVVRPSTLATLCATLERDPGLSAVRPLAASEDGLLHPGSCGWVLDEAGAQAVPVPRAGCRPSEFNPEEQPSYLASSGLLIRLSAWDLVGGFDPWFFPVCWIDVDLGQALRHAGLRFALDAGACITHAGRGSTPSALGDFCVARNHVLLRAKWFPDALPTREERARLVSEQIIDRARDGRSTPRATEPDDLAEIAGICAADFFLRFARWEQRSREELQRAYDLTAEARDWWHSQYDKAAADYEAAIRERDH